MAKYEIMLLISGKVQAPEAETIVQQLKANIKSDNLNVNYLGIKELAYEINKEKTAHYYLLNFDGEANSFFDFHRLALINKSVLRHLIVNLDKDYGARAIKNEKKVKIAKTKQSKYDEIIQNPDTPKAPQRKAKYERPKKRDEWELVQRFDLGNISEPFSATKKLVDNKPKPKVVKFEHKPVVEEIKKSEKIKKPEEIKKPVVEQQKLHVHVEHTSVAKPPKLERPIVHEKKIDIHVHEHVKVENKTHNPKDVEFVKTPVSEVPDIHPKKVEKIRIHAENKSIDEVKNIISAKTLGSKETVKKSPAKNTTSKKSEKNVAKKPITKKPATKKTATKKPDKKVAKTEIKKPVDKKSFKKSESKKSTIKKPAVSKKAGKK